MHISEAKRNSSIDRASSIIFATDFLTSKKVEGDFFHSLSSLQPVVFSKFFYSISFQQFPRRGFEPFTDVTRKWIRISIAENFLLVLFVLWPHECTGNKVPMGLNLAFAFRPLQTFSLTILQTLRLFARLEFRSLSFFFSFCPAVLRQRRPPNVPFFYDDYARGLALFFSLKIIIWMSCCCSGPYDAGAWVML